MKPERRLGLALPILALLVTFAQARAGTSVKAPAPPSQQAIPTTIDYESHLTAGHSPPPAGVLVNPYKNDKSMAAAGANLFASMNCDGCHGGGASGFAAPALADQRWRYGGADEEIFQSIYYGRPKGMPAFGGVLGADGIWILVTYLHSLPPPLTGTTQSWESQAVASSSAPPAASAAAPAAGGADALMKKYACVACHAANTKVVGPSFKDVAAKYRGNKEAEKLLAEKVKTGGSGVWGTVPMPPNPGVPDADLQTIINAILAMK